MDTTNDFPGLKRPMRVHEKRISDIPARPNPPAIAAPFAGQHSNAATALSTAHQKIEDALDRFEADVRPILAGEQSGHLSAQGRSEMMANAAAPALDAIREAQARAEDFANAADDAYKKTRAGLSSRATTPLDALNHQQWWSRIVRELDATPSEKLVGVVQRLIAGADPDELAWAATEIPSYLRSRGVDPGDWLDAALHQVHPGLRQAAERRKLAHQAAHIIASNARTARKALASAASGSYRRPRLVSVDQYDPDA
jgi:hypothetical protein